MEKILFITQNRNDAIGVVDNEQSKILSQSENIFDFLEIHKKGTTRFEIIKNYCRNFWLLLQKTRKYQKIYFSWENPYVWLLRIFGYKGKITMCVHHLEKWSETKIGKKILASCDNFVAISKFTKQQLENAGIKNDKIFVNYNGISKEFFEEKIENFFPKKYILYVGMELPRKNLKNLIRAFEIFSPENPEIMLVKIGNSGNPEAEKGFDNFLEKFPHLQEKILLKREKISVNELRKWYSNAEFYISVSTLEGFGMTIPEAMACCCPIIASKIGPFKEICENENILVNPKNPEEIAEKMQKIISDENFRNEIILHGKSRIEAFSWEKNIKNLISFLQQ